MTDEVRPRKVAMWEFFDEHPEAPSVVQHKRWEELRPSWRQAMELFIAAFGGRRRVLDIGCGTGMPGLYVAPHVGEVAGLDASPNMVAAARENASGLGCGNATYVVGDAQDLPFSDGEFDGAALMATLGSMECAAAEAVMRETGRVLAAEGMLAIMENDWQAFMQDRPHTAARIWQGEGRLTLEVVERRPAPHGERHTRYVVARGTPSDRRLRQELGDTRPAPTDLRLADLRAEDIEDACYDEVTRFDAGTLRNLAAAHGFRDVEVRTVDVLGPTLFLTARK